MIIEFFKLLSRRIAELVYSVLNWPKLALKDHDHPYLKQGEVAKATFRLNEKNTIALKDHKHPYVSSNPFRIKNAATLDKKDYSFFSLNSHKHDDQYQKPFFIGGKSVVPAARYFDYNGLILTPMNLFARSEHVHNQYFRKGERVFQAKAFEGIPPAGISQVNHTHPYVSKNLNRYKLKQTVANKALRLSKGRIRIIQSEGLYGSVRVTQEMFNMSVIGYQMVASIAGKSLGEIQNIFETTPFSSDKFDRCMDYLTEATYDAAKRKAITKYLIVFMSVKTYQKLQPVLYNSAVYMGDNVPPLYVTIEYPISILDAERRNDPISSFVAHAGFTKRIWIPLVPPAFTKSWLSFFDQILFALGTMFIVIISAISLIIAAIINAILDVLIGIFDFLASIPLIGLAFRPVYRALLQLCVKPIGIFKTMDSGILIPMVFVQVQDNDPPTHWLVPDRVYGLTVVAKNIYTTVNKNRIDIDGVVTDISGVAGGYFPNLDEAINRYCKRFEAHFPIAFSNASGVDGYHIVRWAEDVYFGRYVKPWNPTRIRFQAMAAGSTIIMHNSGLPYTIVCIAK